MCNTLIEPISAVVLCGRGATSRVLLLKKPTFLPVINNDNRIIIIG